MRKLGGVLGETEGLGTDDPRVVVGIGVNADWRARDFPPDLAATMTSLHEASGGRPIDLALLHDAFTERLEARIEALRAGSFDLATWLARQVTTGHDVSLQTDVASRSSEPSVSTRPAVPSSSGTPPRWAASASSTPAISSISVSRPRPPMPRPGCNAMARAVLRKASGGPPIARLDRDRPAVEAARRDPARFEALYRKYLAQVYSYALYELGDHHAAEDATARTFLRALAALPRFEERAGPTDPADASTFRVWLFRIARNAVANERRTATAALDSLEASLEAGSRSSTRTTSRRTRSDVTMPRPPSEPCSACRPTGAGRSSCVSSTSCRPRRSPASSAARRGPCACCSTGRFARSHATSAERPR